MRTEQLKYLLEVTSCGSISAAAKRLYINQTTLSAAIQSIETELGGKLFQRTAKGVVLSAFGEQAMPKIQEMADQYESLLLMEGGNAQAPAQIHVCISSCACHFWSIHLSETLRQRNFKTRLVVHESSGNRVFPTVAEGKAAIGIGGCFERKISLLQEEAAKSDLIVEPLYLEVPYIYVSKDSPLAQEKVLACGSLGNYQMALNDCCLDRFYSGRFSKIISQLSVFSSMETAKDAVRRSDMFCILPEIAFEGQPEDKLVAVPMAEAEEESFFSYIIHRRPEDMNPAEQAVVDSVKAWCREHRSLESGPQ